MSEARTPAQKKARQLARLLRPERPDYAYLKKVFHHLRAELDIEVPRSSKKLPYVPSDEEIERYFEVVWQSQRIQDALIVKTLLYTGVRVKELIHIRLEDVNPDECQIQVRAGKGKKDRVVPFPASFRETLALHMRGMKESGAAYLFESSWKKQYSERGIRSMLARYSEAAGLAHPISPHKLRHFLLLWLKKKGIDDALIQPYSGHASRQSLEIYSKLAIKDAQDQYNDVIGDFPV
jgi:integrase/recombinase XerD